MKHQPLQLLGAGDLAHRIDRIIPMMEAAGFDALLVSDNANKLYLTGRIFDGYIYISRPGGIITYLLRRPSHLDGHNVVAIRKPEDIPAAMKHAGRTLYPRTAIELSLIPWAMAERLAKAIGCTCTLNADPLLLQARAVKAPDEIRLIRDCGIRHDRVYSRIPHIFREGMSDIELQIEIERLTRLEGGMGQMRVTGTDMEINMGSVLAGENADTPSPYDFALGGAGASPALPVGADGTIIRPGNTVMVDTNGDFNGYMTDMTRTFSLGDIPDEARRAHQLSIDICRRLEKEARPGVPTARLYEIAIAMATEAGLEHRFMGHERQASFIGHGVGITINELPVLAPRSKDILQADNIIAIEPKFIIEKTGAVGIENTYRVTDNGLERLTNAPEEIISLDN